MLTAASSLSIELVQRPLLLRLLSIPWLLITEGEPRARIRIRERGNGALVHQTRWKFGAAAIIDAMTRDLQELSREDFLALWTA